MLRMYMIYLLVVFLNVLNALCIAQNQNGPFLGFFHHIPAVPDEVTYGRSCLRDWSSPLYGIIQKLQKNTMLH